MPEKEKSVEKSVFKRGSALSIFHTDRREDLFALLLSLGIAFVVYLFVN